MKKKVNLALNILLSDDDKDDRFFFNHALDKIPFETILTVVNDGEQLMSYLKAYSDELPDVLFLDLNMPRKNGFECLYEIKHNKKLKELPVIMFSTSYPFDSGYEKAMIKNLLKIGAFDYIRKPGDFDEMTKIILDSLLTIQKNIIKKL